MTGPIDLYFWPTSNGYKILIALEEMALRYALTPVDIGRGGQFQPDFVKISPNSRMPAIVDPDGPGGQPLSIFESGAILQYLGRKSGQFYPHEERARSEVEQWLYWQVSGIGPMSGQAEHFLDVAPKHVEDPAKLAYARARYVTEVTRLYGVLDRRLADREYLAGDYSIADMATWPWLRGPEQYGQSHDGFPSLKAWFDRIGAREAVRRALQLGPELKRAARAKQG